LIAGARLLAVFPDKTWKQVPTYESGTDVLHLHSALLPIRVRGEAREASAHLERNRRPPMDQERRAIYTTTLDVRFDPAWLGPKFHKSDYA
jgi:N-glycosylase/DNA lyase